MGKSGNGMFQRWGFLWGPPGRGLQSGTGRSCYWLSHGPSDGSVWLLGASGLLVGYARGVTWMLRFQGKSWFHKLCSAPTWMNLHWTKTPQKISRLFSFSRFSGAKRKMGVYERAKPVDSPLSQMSRRSGLVLPQCPCAGLGPWASRAAPGLSL